MKGLIVDTSPLLRLLLIRAFRAAGFTSPLVATDFPDALRTLRTPVDFIITGGYAPHGNSLALVRRLRSATKITRIPIIMITAKRLSSQMLEILAAGANACVMKPFSPAYLSQTVLAAVNSREHHLPVSSR